MVKKSIKDNLYKSVICFSIILLLPFWAVLNHELWTDEAMILIASTEYNLSQLFNYYRYIGYFPIDAILIKTFFYLTGNKIFSLKLITIIFFILSCIILVRIKNLPFEIKILTLLSYPISAEYTLINRNYIFFVPAIFYLFLTHEKKHKYIFFFLSLLNSCGPFGIIISFCYKISNYELFFNLARKKIFFFYSIFTILCIYYFFPFDFQTLDWKKFRLSSEYSVPSFEKIKYVIYNIILSINYLQEINKIDSIWSLYLSNYKIKTFVLIISFLQLISIFLILFIENKRNFIFLLLLIIFFIIAFCIQPRGDWRHYFIFTLIFYIFNIKLFYLEKKKKKLILNKICKKFFIISLIISALISMSFLIKDILYDFSQGKNVANFININKIECSDITSYPPSASNSWIPYLKKNCKPFQFGLDMYSNFHEDLTKGRFLNYNNPDLFLNPKTKYIILKCEFKNRNVDPCEDNYHYYKNLKNFNIKNKVYYFNQETLNGYEKFIIFKIVN